MQFPKREYYYCKLCGKKITLNTGSPTPALIAHMESYHDDQKDKYWDIPISDMVRQCFDTREDNVI